MGDMTREERGSLSTTQGFWETNIGVRLLLGVVFTFLLWAFLHFQQVRQEALELGSLAPHYLVAQVDFSFVDDEATILLRQEALQKIGKIFSLDSQEIASRQRKFEQFLSGNNGWRDQVKDANFEEMYRYADLYTSQMANERFTDPRTLKKITALGMNTTDYTVFTPVDAALPVQLPPEFWQHVAVLAFYGYQVPPTAGDYIEKWFQQEEWSLNEDLSALALVREKTLRAVPAVRTKKAAGDRMIDKGEEVTPRHVAMLQAMNSELQHRKELFSTSTLAGSILLAIVLVVIAAAFLRSYCKEVYFSNKRLFLLVAILVVTMALAQVIEYFLLHSSPNFSRWIRYPLFLPFAAILLCSLLNARIATYATVLLGLILPLGLPFNHIQFVAINILVALVAILSTRSLRKRKEIFTICGKAWACSILLLSAFNLYGHTFLSWTFLGDLLTTLIFLGGTGVVVVGLLPLLEGFFRMVTEITLMEYMDPTHPLLQRLSIEAPGTYQHAIVVGSLAEVAANGIGANGLFCKVATLYHDIGKLTNPQYFTENQQGGVNIHQLLTPAESAQVILAHVPDGVALARKHGLPESFIDIIKEHHGTTVVYYFYHEQLEQVGGDQDLVDEEAFRYKGPKPRSKESGIIMIADTLEAASRAMDEPTEEGLRLLVEQLVREKLDAGQFDNSLLTFEDMEVIKRLMVTSLVSASHTRIKYPERTPPAGHADDPALSGAI
ncbi:MAG: HDIG domain-containing protein [Verrucomicrobia bacterium]|nr:HDIG domain-containing protein [Verrucomicrobiota bacterium]